MYKHEDTPFWYMNQINTLLQEIHALETRLLREIQKNKRNYFFQIINKKIKFQPKVKIKHKTLAKGILLYLWESNPFYIISSPIIYALIIPAFVFDIAVTLYQMCCFPIYRIPKVKRSQYIVIDHQYLGYLNFIEKINCVYCSYFNGMVAYAQEVAARTEQHFCPIKHAQNILTTHSRYNKFLDYGAAEEFKKNILKIENDFRDIKKLNNKKKV